MISPRCVFFGDLGGLLALEVKLFLVRAYGLPLLFDAVARPIVILDQGDTNELIAISFPEPRSKRDFLFLYKIRAQQCRTRILSEEIFQ